MDYTTQPLTFRLRKAARYVRLYGPARTRTKARSYYHMKRRYRTLPPIEPQPPRGRHVGIVGCGKFAYAQIAYFLRKNYGDVVLAAMDADIARAASLYERYGLAYYTDDASRVLSDPHLDTVFIASNHATHAEYAIEALAHGKTVHIEKPHVVTEDQLERLCAAMETSRGRVALGFNRPQSTIGRTIAKHLGAAEGASMLNWFVAGHAIEPEHWYFREEEGGRVLGNLCHWTDFVLQLIPPEARFPVTITPTRAEKADADIAVTYLFADGSIAAITFSAKGHTFEGVKERFAAHRGEVLLTMDDFRTLTVEIGPRKHRIRHRYRSHGHEEMIRHSYLLGRGDAGAGATASYVWETGQLFLRTKEALERAEPVVVDAYRGPSVVAHA